MELHYILFNCSVSIKRLREALRRVIMKHAILHTSFHFDPSTNKWFQRIEPFVNDNEGFTFALTEGVESYDDINRVVMGEFSNVGLFDIERGQLVRLHIARKAKPPPINEDLLQAGDIIIFTIRHEAIAGSSVEIFLFNLARSYDEGELVVDQNAISYLDYTLYQRLIDRSSSITYWEKCMDNMDLILHRVNSRIPSDRPWLLNSYKITHTIPVPFHVDVKLALAMLECARENNVTIASLCLACHFAFLIELTDEWDLIVDCNAAKRPLEPEAVNILGPFVDYIICRVSLDKKNNPTFETLLEKTHNTMMESFDHLFAEEDRLLTEPTQTPSIDRQCSDFQFDEKLQDIVLDKDVRLSHLLNPSDGLPAAIWWRVATDTHFGAYIIYDSKLVELSYTFVFSTATYEQLTAVCIIR
jgi:hypothetical protein